jgi:flagellar motility protein MotE (MotC chaperone)
MRDFRLIPIVLLATACLLALKVLGLVLDGGYVLADQGYSDAPVPSPAQRLVADAPKVAAPATIPAVPQPVAKQSWMQEFLNFSDVTGAHDAPAPKTEAAKAPAKPQPAEPPPSPGGTVISVDTDHPTSPGERAILEHLQTRRQELDAHSREVEIRDSLVKEEERRLDARSSELKDIEARITAATQKKEEADAARLKGLIVMYENMKPKDAAKVFDRLDLRVLIDLASAMNPRRMSDIMAQMQAETASRLTVELANKGSGSDKTPLIDNLPKIEGKPTAAGGNPDDAAGGNPNAPPQPPARGGSQ